METVAAFIFLDSKITVVCDYSLEIKRHSVEDDYDKPRKHITKQIHNFSDKGSYSQSLFSVVMYECESWAMMKDV